MSENPQLNETAQRLKEFHEQSKKVKSPKEPRHSEDVLQFCGVVFIFFSIISGLVLYLGYDFNFFVALGCAFGGFTFGIFLYVIGKICRLLSIMCNTH